MNNNTKSRFKQLRKADRRALAKAGRARLSRHAKVAWQGSQTTRLTSRELPYHLPKSNYVYGWLFTKVQQSLQLAIPYKID